MGFDGRLGRAVNQAHPWPHDVGNDRRQQRIVRASQNQRVDAHFCQCAEVFVNNQSCHVVINPPFLDERHEERTGPRVNHQSGRQSIDCTLVCTGGNRARCADDAYGAAVGCAHGGSRTGFDDADDRHGNDFTKMRQGVRRGGITGDHDELDPFAGKPLRDLGRVLPHGIGALGSIRHSSRVSEINKRLVRQARLQRTDDRQATQSRIKHTNGRVRGTHQRRVATAMTPPAVGSADSDTGTSHSCAATNASAPANR